MSLTIRLRSKEGTERVQVDPATAGEDLAQLIVDALENADPDIDTITLSNAPGSSGQRFGLNALYGRSVADLGFKNGELLFIEFQSSPGGSQPAATTPTTAPAPVVVAAPPVETKPLADLSKIEEDEVDTYWRSQKGLIPRKRDPNFCRHGDKGMCDYCTPLEPYDAAFHSEQKIKHLSFHAYLRQLTGSQSASASSTSASSIPPLTPLNYRVVTPCPSGAHADWPGGICSKCQPSAITLQSQPYRLVDHVEFATPGLIDRFLEGWRRSGAQRLGWLVGRYEPYESVPMGVKAVVETIVEPDQEGEVDGLGTDVPWADEERIAQLASLVKKGLLVVGVVYTDLTPSPDDITKVLYKRHPQSFTISSLEALFSATLQSLHPLATKSSPTGVFGSRFVSCVLTGTVDGGVDVVAYQASEQAVKMREADIVEASVDPGMVRVKKEGKERYVPDVFYTFKNEYKLQVKQTAKPCFPVEYLLVTLTHGFPVSPSPLFPSSSFPIARPAGLSTDQQSTSKVVNSLLSVFRPFVGEYGSIQEVDLAEVVDALGNWAGDWHLLEFMQREGGLEEDEMKLLARLAMIQSDRNDALKALKRLWTEPGWQTLLGIVQSAREAQAAEAVARAHDVQPMDADGFPDIPPDHDDPFNGGGGGGVTVCPHCTFENDHSGGDCDICGLPLQG